MLNTNKKIKISKDPERGILEKRSKGQKALFIVAFVIMFTYCLTLLISFAWLIMSSFKGDMEYADINNSAFALPEIWHFENWALVPQYLVVEGTDYIGMLFNSLWYTVGSTTISILCITMMAYCLVKYDFKLKNVMSMTIIVTMIIPIIGSLPAAYKMYYTLRIADSPLILLASTGGLGFYSIIMQGFFRGVSNSYAEAARIDGAGHHVIFWKIIMPQAIGPILSLWILAAIAKWNDYSSPILFLPSYPTLSSGLYQYESSMTRLLNMPVYFAGVILSALPVLILFILFQDTIMNNVTAGGLKG
ncbi:MAG: carbohydrate ABC transporter permease [Clostridia bacterium]|nr:carbohydrate ABC transporter permease [Clostridia bacterium]